MGQKWQFDIEHDICDGGEVKFCHGDQSGVEIWWCGGAAGITQPRIHQV